MRDTIRISCNRHNLRVVRDFVTAYLESYNLSDVLLNQVLVAVDEVVANMIIHGNAEDDSKFLNLKVKVEDQTFTIEIEDIGGEAFSPSTLPELNLPDIVRRGQKGGVGMALVNRIMDEVEFTRDNKHNICRLSKRLSSPIE